MLKRYVMSPSSTRNLTDTFSSSTNEVFVLHAYIIGPDNSDLLVRVLMSMYMYKMFVSQLDNLKQCGLFVKFKRILLIPE